jgi:hypothetical protein
MPRGVEVGKGNPNETLNATGRVGKGIVVRGRENRPHDGEEESKNTPPAKALSFRKLRMQR